MRQWVEVVLLLSGLVALDCVIWVNAHSVLSQAYDSWSLDQQRKGLRPDRRVFVAQELGLPWLAPSKVDTSDKEAKARAATPRKQRLPEFTLIGRVQVPRLGLSATVREGVADETLRSAVGHMPTTPLPGEDGNVAIAAHRDTLFRKLQGVRRKDRIVVQTVGGDYAYEVQSTKIVSPSDVSVLEPAPGEKTLTLITCYPFNYVGAAPERFIVRARQVQFLAQAAYYKR